MITDYLTTLKTRLKDSQKRIVFPEGMEERIIQAAASLVKEGIAIPILLGDNSVITQMISRADISASKVEIIDVSVAASRDLDKYAEAYCTGRELPKGAALRILGKSLYYGAMMVKMGDADAMVAGLAHATEDVIMASELILGMDEGVSTPSSFFLMEIPGYAGDEGNLLIFADPAVNPDPTPEQLADIAVATARSAATMFDWEPRVAMLSFSTKGSALHASVEKVKQAVEIVKELAPDLLIDGELQADAAIVPRIAQKKLRDVGKVAGRANILIFPDLNAANIAYKLVQQLAKAAAYGPILQGFAGPVTDLSRGATVEDIIGATIMVAMRDQ
jgi:phosphate acetyltransferase